MNFIPHDVDILLNNILPNLDRTSDIGRIIFGLLEVQNNFYHEAEIAFQRLKSDAQELKSMVKKYCQLTDRLKNLNDQLSANNIHLSEDNSRLRDENLRLLDENDKLIEKIAQSRKGEGSQ